jgi:hypothetical protein
VIPRDVIFDEQETFDGNLESLRDDIREIDLEELAELLQKCSIPEEEQGGQVHPVQEEPQEVRDLEGLADDEFEVQPRERAANSSAGSEEGTIRQGTNEQSEKLFTKARFVLLPTPPPSPPAAMLAAAIRPLGDLSQEQDFQGGRPKGGLGKENQTRRAELGGALRLLGKQSQTSQQSLGAQNIWDNSPRARLSTSRSTAKEDTPRRNRRPNDYFRRYFAGRLDQERAPEPLQGRDCAHWSGRQGVSAYEAWEH